MLAPFPVSLPQTPLCLYKGAPPPTYPFPPHFISIPLCWYNKSLKDHEPPLPTDAR